MGSGALCFQDCCTSDVNHCYAKPSSGCKDKGLEIPSCNGVAGGCLCDAADPSKCPAPPPCTGVPVPFCMDIPSAGDVCDFSSVGGNPCPATGGSCDPNTRQVTCACGS